MKVIHVMRRAGDDRAWAAVRRHAHEAHGVGVLLVQEAALSEAGRSCHCTLRHQDAVRSPQIAPAGVPCITLPADAPVADYRRALRELLAADVVISW